MLTCDVSKLSLVKEPFSDRIKRLRKAKGLSPQQFADAIGVSRPTVVMWESGASERPESRNLLRAAEVLGVDPYYLEHGDEPRAVSSRNGLRNIPIIGHAIATPGEDGYFDDMGFPPGGGEGYIAWPTRDPNAYALKVKGDSMQPAIPAGKYIVIEPAHAVHDMDDVLVRLKNGRKMVKQLLKLRKTEVILGSVNQAHPQTTISLEDVESIQYVAAVLPSSTRIEENNT